MAIFRVKEGRRFGAGKVFGPGDMVEVDEAAAAGFLDLLEPVTEEVEVVQEEQVEVEPTEVKKARK